MTPKAYQQNCNKKD